MSAAGAPPTTAALAEGLNVHETPSDASGPLGAALSPDWWGWAHSVAAATSSPSRLQEALLQQGWQEAERLTGLGREGPQFWSGPLQSRVLSAISRLKRPRTILEIGAFIGISSGASTHFLFPSHCSVTNTLVAVAVIVP